MGAIQQAFNQALNITAIATVPARAAKKERIAEQKTKIKEAAAEEKRITEVETAADKAFERMETAFGEKGHTEQEMHDYLKEAYEAQEESYRARPTLAKGALRSQLFEDYQEFIKPAEKAAAATKQQQEIYKDQQATMAAVKSKGKQLIEKAEKIKGGKK